MDDSINNPSGDTNYDNYGAHNRNRPTFLQRIFQRKNNNLQIILFILTIGSTYSVGGMVYSVTIMSILLAHEMGHYLMCRRHNIAATLPYFIPFPKSLFGTFGAVIAMQQRIPNRKALFDVAVAGPLAGLVIAFPAILYGLQLSEVKEISTLQGSWSMGEPIIFQFIRHYIFGPLPEGMDVFLHPMAYAGWVGLFVTALNLLPIGQLDGGHIAYAMFGKKSRYVFAVAFVFFAICSFFFYGWIPMLILLAFLFYRHPPTWDDITLLDSNRRMLGFFMLLIFILTFTPVPFHF